MFDSVSQELVVVEVNGENRIDSRLVAKSLGIEHINFRETLDKYQNELEELGKVRFETEASGKTRQPQKYYMLNEDQAIFAATLSRNTKQVVTFKLKLTKAFSEARAKLASQQHLTEEQIFTKDVQHRCMLNEKLLPRGYWCVVTEMWREAWTLEAFQKELKPSSLPDGSCGTKWRNYLKSINHTLLPKSKQEYLHVPNLKNRVKVYIYPDELLSEFRTWIRVEYADYYVMSYSPSRLKDAKEVEAPKKRRWLR